MTGTTDREYLKTNEQLSGGTPSKNVRFLVTISASMDGFPIREFETEAEALAFIRDNPPYPFNGDDLNSPEVKAAIRIGGADIGNLYGYELFDLVGGKPTQRRLYWWGESGVDFPGWLPADGWYVDDNSTIRAMPDPD